MFYQSRRGVDGKQLSLAVEQKIRTFSLRTSNNVKRKWVVPAFENDAEVGSVFSWDNSRYSNVSSPNVVAYWYSGCFGVKIWTPSMLIYVNLSSVMYSQGDNRNAPSLISAPLSSVSFSKLCITDPLSQIPVHLLTSWWSGQMKHKHTDGVHI